MPGAITGKFACATWAYVSQKVVDIIYDTKSYGILYKDSSNLQYDGKTIHSNYNGWIQNLDKAIRTQLGLL